jgi:hypothetical protein
MPNPQAGGPPLVGCPLLLIQYICSYPPYMEAVSSIRNLSTRHAVVTRDPPNMEQQVFMLQYFKAEFLTFVLYNIIYFHV